MNKTILQGKWRHVRGNLKSEWGRLTDNDRRQLEGKIDQMVGLFQERYGYTQERAAKAVTHYLGNYGAQKSKLTPTSARPWVPFEAVALVFGAVALGWFLMTQLFHAAAELANDDEVESALEEALFDPDAV